MPVVKLIEKSSCVSWLNYSEDAPDVQTEVRVKLSGGQLTVAHRTINNGAVTDWQELVTWLPAEAYEALATMFAVPDAVTLTALADTILTQQQQATSDEVVKVLDQFNELLVLHGAGNKNMLPPPVEAHYRRWASHPQARWSMDGALRLYRALTW